VEFNWKTADGLQLFGKNWAIENPKAVVALVHGFGEHCMRYDAMAKFYNQKGYAVMSFDHRGHGQSEGGRGDTPNYEAFLDGIDDLLAKCIDRYPGKPIVIYGHSMGGNLVLNYMIERGNPNIKLTVVTGPWIRLSKEPPWILKLILKIIKAIKPSFAQTNSLADLISRVQEEVNKYKNDPLVHGRITVVAALAILTRGAFLYNYKGKLETPTLIMHGGDDQITDPSASKVFYKNVSGDVDLRIWDGLYHEIHKKSIREQVYNYTIDWLDQKL